MGLSREEKVLLPVAEHLYMVKQDSAGMDFGRDPEAIEQILEGGEP